MGKSQYLRQYAYLLHMYWGGMIEWMQLWRKMKLEYVKIC